MKEDTGLSVSNWQSTPKLQGYPGYNEQSHVEDIDWSTFWQGGQ